MVELRRVPEADVEKCAHHQTDHVLPANGMLVCKVRALGTVSESLCQPHSITVIVSRTSACSKASMAVTCSWHGSLQRCTPVHLFISAPPC